MKSIFSSIGFLEWKHLVFGWEVGGVGESETKHQGCNKETKCGFLWQQRWQHYAPPPPGKRVWAGQLPASAASPASARMDGAALTVSPLCSVASWEAPGSRSEAPVGRCLTVCDCWLGLCPGV